MDEFHLVPRGEEARKAFVIANKGKRIKASSGVIGRIVGYSERGECSPIMEVKDRGLLKKEDKEIIDRDGRIWSAFFFRELNICYGCQYFWDYIFLEEEKSKNDYPHKCPRCGASAYVGFNVRIDCSNSNCK